MSHELVRATKRLVSTGEKVDRRDVARADRACPDVRLLMTTRTELLELIRNGESSLVEFKRDTVTNRDLAEELVALANLQGGRVLLGVDDDGSVPGVTRASLEKWVMTACRDKSRPEIIPAFELIRDVDNGRDVAVITIEAGNAVHHVWHDQHRTYYIRVGTRSREASPEELGRLFQQRVAMRSELHASRARAWSPSTRADLTTTSVESGTSPYRSLLTIVSAFSSTPSCSTRGVPPRWRARCASAGTSPGRCRTRGSARPPTRAWRRTARRRNGRPCDYLLTSTDIELSLYADRLEVISPGRLPNMGHRRGNARGGAGHPQPADQGRDAGLRLLGAHGDGRPAEDHRACTPTTAPTRTSSSAKRA